MELVTKRDMDDAKALAERAGIESMDDFDMFIHDIAQSIADGRRVNERNAPATAAQMLSAGLATAGQSHCSERENDCEQDEGA